MKICITGGRYYSNRKFLFNVLDQIHRIHTISCLVNGGARGADTLASEWAMYRQIQLHIHFAEWKNIITKLALSEM